MLRYKAEGKTHRYALGRFGESDGLLSLDAARALASEWREKMRRGTYPHEAQDRDRELVKLERDTRRSAPTLSTLPNCSGANTWSGIPDAPSTG